MAWHRQATSHHLNQYWPTLLTHLCVTWPWCAKWSDMHIWEMRIFTLRPRQNGCHFAANIFNCIFLNKNVWILIKVSLKFVPNVPTNNIPPLVLIMAWCRLGNKPLSEPMMVRLLTHIYVSQPQWVNNEMTNPGSITLLILVRCWSSFGWNLQCLWDNIWDSLVTHVDCFTKRTQGLRPHKLKCLETIGNYLS